MKTEWLDREAAAKQLNRSVRRVVEFATAGKIRSQQGIDEKTGRPATFLHAGDVERMREHLQTRKKTAVARALSTVDKPRAQELALLAANGNANAQFPLPWLALDQAAKKSGLPAAYIRRLIERGELPARNILEGTNAKATLWRVRLQDIESLQGKTQEQR